MSRFGERLERDLAQIADRAAPSPDAWDTIRQRIDAPESRTETEIIMLSPERQHPDRRRTWLLATAAALVAVLAIGLAVVPRSDDGGEPATTPAPTTTEARAPVVIGDEHLGIVWESSVDPVRVNASEGRPELIDGPLRARVDSFISTPGPEESPFCADAVEEGATGPGGERRDVPDVTSCLVVEWQFDVGEGAVNNPGMDARNAVTADGRELEPLVYDFPDAAPGGSASGSVVYPNLGPGSQIYIGYQVDLPDGSIIFERWEVVVPDAFQPIDWFEDER